ncbi:LPXTG cell wall anchor domain-containing protein [Staphylococcus warneri]|nr:Ig-like domain-containing protein [Staphylococcus warneri]MCE5012831.1 LPXTG cell wall anchor domain-containing protein [Staphylococcus warneri]
MSKTEAKEILNNTDVDFNKATDEEINQAVLQAALTEMANKQKSTETLATPPRTRTFMRAMATPRMLAAAVTNTDQNVQKSLATSDNYTFASLVFDPEALDSDAVKNSTSIPFNIDAYMSGANSGTRYKIDLNLDSKIADHVTKISVNPAGSNTPVQFTRLKNDDGTPSNIWEVNYIRASGGLFGGAEILASKTASGGKIELDDTVGNILNNAGDLSNNKLNYQIYVRDSSNNTIIRTSESSGYFLTDADKDLVSLNNNKSTANANDFKASSGTASLDTKVGNNGAIIVDQQVIKDGIFGYGGAQNKQWSYNYQIDKDLIPFIQSVELDKYDYDGLKGFDKTYNAANKVADLSIDANGNGTITASDLNKLIEFNNGLPETVGMRIVIKLNQSPNNILTKDAQYDAKGNLISSTTDQVEDFTFAGYLTDNAGKLINNTLGTSSLELQDYDKDGLLDRYEREVSLTDPNNADTDGDTKNDGDEVKTYHTSPLVGQPNAADITINDTKVSGSVTLKPNAGTQTAKVINSTGQVIGTSTVNSDGTFTVTIPKSVAGQYTIAIDAPNYDNDETNTFNIVDNTIVPAPLVDPVDDNDTTIGVHGTAGSTVTVKDSNNNVIGTVTLGANSTTGTLTLSKPLAAGTQLTSTATKNGKTSAVSPTVTVTDATAPDAPVINPVTSDDTTVTGKAEPNSTVTVTFPDGTTQVTTADASGNYTVNIPANEDFTGGETIKASAKDAAGNKSVDSNVTVTDTTAPNQPTVNQVTSEDKTITGKAEPNSTVTVTFPDGTKVQAITATDGSYRVAVPTNIDLVGGETLGVTSTDKAGNTSTAANTTVVDVTAPKEPVINDVTSEDKTITGTSEPNSTVTVTFPDGTKASATADASGNYTIGIPDSEDLKGDEELSVVATDAAGNVSVDAGTTVLDKTPPEVPTINPVTSEDKTITGKAEPNSTVTVTFPDGTTANATTDGDGNYTIDIPANEDLKGGEALPVTSTDGAGNQSGAATTTVTDTTAPTVPTINPVTSEDKTITGHAEPGSTVTVTFPDGNTATGTTDADGNYVINIPTDEDLKGGEELPVTSTDKAGNKSDVATTEVTDTTAPEAPTVNPVTSDDTTITGKAEPNSTVTVTFPDGTTATGNTDADGNYVIDIPSNEDLKGGETLPVTSTDKAGNTSQPASTVVTDTTAPTVPSVIPVSSEDKTVTGKAEPGSTVTVTFPDGTTASGTTDADGNYTIDIPANEDLKGGETLPVTATDKDGNKSEEATTTVSDKTAPEAPTVNPVTSDDTQITGKAEPNSTVTVTFPDGHTASGTTDADGNYVINITSSEDLKGGETLPVTATDKAGNTSEQASTVVTDTTAPTVPSVNPVTSDDTQITGKAEPGSTVTVTFPDGTTATGTTDADGNYTIDIPANEDLKGGETLPVTATDKDGNKSEPATTVVTDTTAPTVPSVNPVTSDDTQITGKAEPGSTVTVTFPDGNTASGTTDADGNYVINIPSGEDLKGGETLPVTATDKDGNKSEPATTVVTDTTAPTVPTVNPVTSDDKTITGKAEPGSTVTVTFPDGNTASGTTDEDGNYTITIPTNEDLKGGEALPVTSTDKAGNTSAPATTTVTDTTAPTAPSVNPVTSDDTQITGKAEPGSTVTVTFPDGTKASGTTDADGNYVIDIPANEDLKGGETLPVTATDKAGNQSGETTTTVTDTTAPTAPSVNPVTSDDKTITGKAEPGSTVTVTFPDGTTTTGTADQDGNYVIDIPANEDLKGGETLPVTATDKDGNKSEPTSTVVTDTTAPTVPSVNPVTSDDTQITGKAEPGSTVTVTFPDGTTATGTTDENGNYVIDIPSNEDLKGGETLPVTATDKDGNKSEPATTVVTDTTAPTVPSVNPVTSDDKTITGKAEPGSTVTVTFPDGNTATGTTDADGNYVINIPSSEDLKGGETLPVTATDKDGNKSEPATTVVTDTTAPSTPTVNPVTSDDTQITGKAEPGSTVTVTFPDGKTASSTTDADGNYVINIPSSEDLKGGEELPVTATDKAGNTSDKATTVVTDTTAPTVPSVNPVTSDDTQITGKAEPNSTVTVTFPDGTKASGTTDADGNYVIDIPANEDLKGGETLPVTATDKDGNESQPSTTVVTDTTAPTVPSVNPVTSDDKTITGKAEPGSTVTVTFPDGTKASGTTDADGNYVINIPANEDLKGGETLPVTATDKDGNESEPATTVVTDTTAPSVPTINPVTSDDTQITGKAEPGSTVTVTFPDGTKATGKTDADGNYVINIPANEDLKGGETLPVTATDKDGNESQPSTTVVTDTTAPSVPTVNPVTSDDTQITGKAEPGSTVTVTFPDGTKATGTTDADGNYVIDIPANEDLKGGETLPVTSTDKDGNQSEPASTVVTDTTAPSVPTVNPVTSNDKTITGKAEPGSTVTVTFPDGSTSTGKADQDGNYVIDIPANEDLKGGETLPVTSTDKDGNTSEPATTVVTDTTAPTVPSVNPVTSDDKTITGKAEPGSTVTVTFPDGTKASGTTDADGNYVINIPANEDLKGGETLPVTATDKDGNESEPATTVVTDTTAPSVPTINPVTSDDTQITGKAEPGSTVTVTFPDGTKATGKTDADGNYVINIPANEDLKGGETLPVTATDKDGNESQPSTTVVTDTTAPSVPTVNPVTSDDTQITGKAEPGSTVTVTFPDGTKATGTTDADGNYVIDIPANEDLKGGETLPVTSTDKDGNQSEPASTVVTDTTAPSVPTVNPVTSNDKTITGKAEPGSTVTVTFPDGSTSTGKADQDGNYVIDIPANEDLKGGETLPVTSTDKDGNTSEPATTVVTDTTAPEAPTVNPVTSDDTQITGKAEPNSTVTVTFPDGTTASGTTDADGNYVIDIPANEDLKGGETLPVTATDKDGNTSDKTTTVVTDTTAPTVPTINPVTSEDKTITGKAEPGSTVTVTFPDGTTATGKTDENGNYVIDIPANEDLKGGETLPVTATDKDGNESQPTTTVVTDTTAPSVPTINPVTSDDTQITGKAEPNSTVTVTFPDGTTATGKTDENGNYVIDIPSNEDLKGGETLPVTATDKDGNTSEPATTVVTDTTAPTVPTINPVTSEDKTITGKAEPGSTVTVTFPDGTTATGTTDNNGNYVINIPTNEDLKGGETLPVTSTDKDGNTSEPASTVVTDTTAPSVPTVNPVTSDDTQITGKAEPGSTVTVTFSDGTTATGTADQDGNYVIDIPSNEDLKGGETLPVTSTDKDGNQSEPAKTVVTDTTAPSVPTINPVTSEDTQITGKAEPGSTVTVTFPDGTTATGKTDENGNYVIDIPSNEDLKGGETLPVTATDKDGNTSEPATTVVTDTTAPEAPTVNPVHKGDKTITGKAEPGSTVTITFPDGTTATGKTDENGNYVIDIPAGENLKGGDHIGVTATDANGNTSPSTDGTVIDDGKPVDPSQPTDPTYPGKQTDPSQPSEPTNPGEVTEPGQPTEQPTQGHVSGNNVTSNGTVQQSNHETASTNKGNNHEKDQSELPETGQDGVNKGTLFGTLLAGLGALFLFFKRRREDEEEEEK